MVPINVMKKIKEEYQLEKQIKMILRLLVVVLMGMKNKDLLYLI